MANADSDGKDESVVSSADLDWETYDHSNRTFRRKRLGAAAGGEALGTSLYELEPGNRTWPRHYHAGNEEAIYVLEGELRLWLGQSPEETEHRLSPGDYVALPAGPDQAHELEALGEEPARFLVTSTMNDPDLSVLVERDVAMVMGGAPPGDRGHRYLSTTVDLDAEVDYWE